MISDVASSYQSMSLTILNSAWLFSQFTNLCVVFMSFSFPNTPTDFLRDSVHNVSN